MNAKQDHQYMLVTDEHFMEINLFIQLFDDVNSLTRDVRFAVHIDNVIADPLKHVSKIVKLRSHLENIKEAYERDCKYFFLF